MPDTQSRSARIAALNDAFRYSFEGGKIFISKGIQALPEQVRLRIMALVNYDKGPFTEENDPYGEHDFNTFAYQLPDRSYIQVNWKIDYYNLDLSAGSEDPADPAVTTRVLTIMLAEEY